MLTKDTPLHQLDRKNFAPGSAPAVRPNPIVARSVLQMPDPLSMAACFSIGFDPAGSAIPYAVHSRASQHARVG